MKLIKNPRMPSIRRLCKHSLESEDTVILTSTRGLVEQLADVINVTQRLKED